MAKTYNYLPHDVAELFRAIVVTVNDNLVSETSLSIPRVTFKAETWKELCNRLKADSESSSRKSTRYPMVALIRDYDYTTQANSIYTDVSLKLIIVTQTTFEKLSEDRQAENYQPILYPIRSELMEQIALCRYFHGPYDPWPAHKCAESFNLSKDNNNGALALPDYVDALIITDLRLKINQQMIAGFSYGIARVLIYENNVSSLTVVEDGNQITVNLLSARHIDTLALGHPVYTVSYPDGYGEGGDNIETGITVGGQATITFEDGYQDGEYVGYIQCDDEITVSRLKFYYKITNGVVSAYTPANQFTLEDFSLGGLDYPNYPFQTTVAVVANKSIISRIDMSSDGGNEISTQYFTPLVGDTGTIETTQYMEAPTTYRDVICQVALNGSETDIILDSISYYKLNTI